MRHLLASSPSTELSLHVAHALAMAAEGVYESPAAVEQSAIDDWGFDEFAFFDCEDTQCFLASDDHSIVVSFRGTEPNDLADWLTDIDMTLVEGPLGGRVHGGFYDALADVWQSLEIMLARCDRHHRKRLWITGHSLGGALAALAAARWIERGRNVDGVATFGQPRTGDRTFCRNFNFALKAHALRFVNNNDLVTRVPPRSLGFQHLGTFRYFTAAGALDSSIDSWREFLGRWTIELGDLISNAFDGIYDHSMIAYRQLVARHAAALPAPLALYTGDDAPRQLVTPRRRAA